MFAKWFEPLKKRVSQLYFITVFTVLTFYMHDGYLDTIQAKGYMLLAITLPYVLIMLISDIVLNLSGGVVGAKFIKSLDLMDFALLGFAVAATLSALFSETKYEAFLGSSGCRLGALSIVLLCLSCISLRRNLLLEPYMLLIMAVSGMAVVLLGITDCFDLDLMGWHENIVEIHTDYLSTMGNRDYYDGYLALVLPFFMMLFIFETKLQTRIFYGIYLFLGFIGLYLVRNDGNLLIFGSGIFLVYYMLREHKDVLPAVYIALIFVASTFVVQLFCRLTNPFDVVGNTVMGLLQGLYWHIGVLLLALVLYLLRNTKISYFPAKIWIGISLAVIVIMFVVVFFTYNRTFASNRGYIWGYGIETFLRSPLKEKLIGWGADCYKNAIYSTVGSEIQMTWPEEKMIANAHCEIIQYLVTTGIIGKLFYLALFGISLFSKEKQFDRSVIAARTAIFAYFCVALGTNPDGLNYGILFVMFSIATKKLTQTNFWKSVEI